MTVRTWRRPAAVLAAVVVAACSQGDQETLRTQKVPGTAATVAIVDSPETVGGFQPQVVHIAAGQSAGWINASGDYHTVSFEDPGSPTSSHGFGHGQTFTVRFPRPGTFHYRCLYHDGMTGEVVVAPAPTPSASPST